MAAGNIFSKSWSRIKTGSKWAAIASLVVGAAVAVPLIASSFREKRRVDPDDVPLPPELDAPPPPAPQFIPREIPPQETLMGMEPVEGDRAKRVKMQRAGLSAGPDTSSPSIMRPDGSNAVDGSRAVEDLGAPAVRGI